MNLIQWTQCVICTAIGTAIGLSVGLSRSQTPEVVTAKRFVILAGDRDEIVGELGSDRGSSPTGVHLWFKNRDGETTMKLSSRDGHTFFETFAGDKPKVKLGHNDSDSRLYLEGGGGDFFAIADSDFASMSVHGSDKQKVTLTAGDPIGPSMVAADTEGADRFKLITGIKGKPMLLLTDKDDNEFDAFAGLKPPAQGERKR